MNQVRLILEENFLKNNFSEKLLEKYGAYENQNLNLIDFSPSNINFSIIINSIFNKSITSEFDLLYFQSKALELICIELNKTKKTIVLNDYKRKALFKAKELLLEDKISLTISNLAREVNLSEIKLKNGFKEMFGTSPYNFLKSNRLKNAKKLLLSGEFNITEVAHIIGYNHSGNFSYAFKKEFGINPKEIMKSVKYY